MEGFHLFFLHKMVDLYPLLPRQDDRPVESPEWQKEEASYISSNKNNAGIVNVLHNC